MKTIKVLTVNRNNSIVAVFDKSLSDFAIQKQIENNKGILQPFVDFEIDDSLTNISNELNGEIWVEFVLNGEVEDFTIFQIKEIPFLTTS